MPYKLTEQHESLAEFQAEYIDRYIALADTKAAVAFGVVAAVTGYVITYAAFQDTLGLGPCVVTFWLAVATLVCLMSAAGAALAVVLPRVWLSPKDGLISWPAVSKYRDATAYLDALSNATSDEVRVARATHCYDLARICAAKHRWVAWTFFLTAASMLLSGIFVLFV